jgi:hypothetical protein
MCSIASDETFTQVVLARGQREYFQQRRAVSCWRRVLQHKLAYERALMSRRNYIDKCKMRSHFRGWLSVHRRNLTVSSWRQTRQLKILKRHLFAWRMCAMRNALINAIGCNIRRGLLRSCLQQWNLVAADLKQKQYAAARLLRILRLTALKISFRRLQKRAQASHKSLTLGILGSHFQLARLPMHVVRRWRAQARRLVRTREKVVGHSAHRRIQTLQHAFGALKKHAMVRKDARAHDFLAYAHHSSKSLRRAWEGLKRAIHMYRSEQPLLEQCRQYLCNWRKTVASKKVDVDERLLAARHYRTIILRRIFDTWCEFSRCQRVKADKNFVALMFRRMALEQGCLTHWFRAVQQQQRLQTFGARLWKVTSVVRLSTTLAAWKRFVREQRQLKAATKHHVNCTYRVVFAAFAQHVQRHRLARQDTIARMRSILVVRLASCIRSWRMVAVRNGRTRSIENVLRRSLALRQQDAVLSFWKQYATRHLALEHAELLVARRVRTGRLASIFTCWRRLASVTVSRSDAAIALSHFRSRLLLRRWLHALKLRTTCRRVWSRVEARVEARVHNQQMSAAFRRWKETVVAAHTASVLDCAANQRYRYTLLCKGFKGLDGFRQVRQCDRQKQEAIQRRCDTTRANAAWRQLILTHRTFEIETTRSAHAYGHRGMRLQRTCFSAWRHWLDHRKHLLYKLSLPNGIPGRARLARNLDDLLTVPRERTSPSYEIRVEEAAMDPLSMALADVDSAEAALHAVTSAVMADCTSTNECGSDSHPSTAVHVQALDGQQSHMRRRAKPRALDPNEVDHMSPAAAALSHHETAAIADQPQVSAAACQSRTSSAAGPQAPACPPSETARMESDDGRMSPAAFMECEAQVVYWQSQIVEATNRERELLECDARILVLQQLLCARDAVPCFADESSLLLQSALVQLQTHRQGLLEEQLKWTKLWNMMEPRVFHRKMQLERCRKYFNT